MDSVKLCECGCGGAAPLAKQSHVQKGHVKGQPVRFIKGHWARTEVNRGATHANWTGGRRLNANGYVLVKQPGHGRAHHNGEVFEHIIVAELALGHPLPPQAEVHHVNEVRNDNKNKNLVICEDQNYHALLHARSRGWKACCDVHARQCWVCKQWGGELRMRKNGTTEHKACENDYQRQRKLTKEASWDLISVCQHQS